MSYDDNKNIDKIIVIIVVSMLGLKRRLKASVEQVAVLRFVGRLFQALGAATENALSANRRLMRGTT